MRLGKKGTQPMTPMQSNKADTKKYNMAMSFPYLIGSYPCPNIHLNPQGLLIKVGKKCDY